MICDEEDNDITPQDKLKSGTRTCTIPGAHHGHAKQYSDMEVKIEHNKDKTSISRISQIRN